MKRKNVLVIATGSVAAVKVPQLILKLHAFANVKLITTECGDAFLGKSSEYDRQSYDAFIELNVVKLKDKDEWNSWQKIGDPVLHIELRDWADVLLIAPLSANTLAKIANGICDNLATCVVRAWDMKKPGVVAPAMNTQMWIHPITEKQLSAISLPFQIIPPISKTLACGEIGVGGLASIDDIVQTITNIL